MSIRYRVLVIAALLGCILTPLRMVFAQDEGDAEALRTLQRVLQNPLFQYEDETPPPAEAEPVSTGSGASTGWGDLFVLIGGVSIIIMIMLYLTRNLRVQTALLSEDTNEDPVTSEAAHAMANRSTAEMDYRAAIRYLYLAALLNLHERGIIRYDPTQTNREHLAQIASKPQLADTLAQVVGIFDRAWYGFAPIDEALYTHFRGLVERLGRIES